MGHWLSFQNYLRPGKLSLTYVDERVFEIESGDNAVIEDDSPMVRSCSLAVIDKDLVPLTVIASASYHADFMIIFDMKKYDTNGHTHILSECGETLMDGLLAGLRRSSNRTKVYRGNSS